MTAQPSAQVRFRRAIERRALWLAEDAAHELPNLPLSDALQLVHPSPHGSEYPIEHDRFVSSDE